ncbi:hypothetical protein BDF19DRAFT_412178 [Syncephalis fuscata]|nr:hypothetical protein BDF19DRAFT_412178 [Syncephalis fuscata]
MIVRGMDDPSVNNVTVIASGPDEPLTRTPSLPASPSNSLRFARPPRPNSRGNRRHSLVGVFPSATDAVITTAAESTPVMQRSASHAPFSNNEHTIEGNESTGRPRRPMSYHAGFQRNLFSQESNQRLMAVTESAALMTTVKEITMTETEDIDMSLPVSKAEPNIIPDIDTESMESNVVKEDCPSLEETPDASYSIISDDTPSFAAMMADMIAYPTVSPLLPVVSPSNGLSMLVDATYEETTTVEETTTEQTTNVEEITDKQIVTESVVTRESMVESSDTTEQVTTSTTEIGTTNDIQDDDESDLRITYDNTELQDSIIDGLAINATDNTIVTTITDTTIKEVFSDMDPDEDDSDSNAEVPSVIGMLSPERVRDSVILQAEKSPQLLALRNIDDIDDIDPLSGSHDGDSNNSGSNSDEDMAALSLPGVLNPANLVVDEAMPPKSPLLGNADHDHEHTTIEQALISPIECLPSSAFIENREILDAMTDTSVHPLVDGEVSMLSTSALSIGFPIAPGSPAVVPTEMISTMSGMSDGHDHTLIGEGHGSPLVYTTAGPANGERQILIARLCSLGHSEGAANDALDALPSGNFDELLLWISRRRLAILKSDAEEEKRLRRLEEVGRAGGSVNGSSSVGGSNGTTSVTSLRGPSHHLSGLGVSGRLSDADSEDSTILLPDVQLIDRTTICDPLHRPPDSRTTPRPRSILKPPPSKMNKEGRMEVARIYLKIRQLLHYGNDHVYGFHYRPVHHHISIDHGWIRWMGRKEAFHQRQGGSLRTKPSPYSAYLPAPPSPSLSVESDELPIRQLKQVRFPVQAMAIKYLYVAERPIQPGLRLDEHGRTEDGQLLDANGHAQLLSHQNNQGVYDSLEALASNTQLSGVDHPPGLVSLAGGEQVNGSRSSGHASTLHPATKSEAQAGITIDAALAAGAPRDINDDSPITPIEEARLHSARELSVYYRRACQARHERPIDSVLQQLRRASERAEPLTTLSLTGILLERRAADALSDMLILRSGLQRLELNDCSLVNDALKSILHSLLLVDELQELSLCRNKRISADGFKYIAIYTRKAKHLRLLDLSGCRPDKRGCRYLSHALASSSVMMLRSALRTLYLNDCNLRSTLLEVLVPSIRRSNVTELSMTHNRFGPNGAIWVAALLDADWLPSEESNGLFAGIESRVERLNLSYNDIRVSGFTVALRKNRTLNELDLASNELNSRALSSLAMSLTENATLTCLNLSGNPLSGPAIDGIMQLRASLTFNNTLHTLLLANTDMRSEGAIALAEFLPETQTLRRLDLSDNPEIDIAGVMALSVSVRMNKSLQYLDVNVMPDDSEMAALSRDILLTCIRNTQLQEKSTRSTNNTRKNSSSSSTSVFTDPPPRSSSRPSSVDLRASTA